MKTRTVPIEEIESCPTKRLDAEHYIPIHKIWECRHGRKLRTKGAVVEAWLDGKITTEAFLLAMQHVKQ